VPELAPFLLAVGLERLADEGKLTLPDEKRRELAALSQSDGGAALAAELEKAAGKSWRDYLQQEILGPLGMANARLPKGPAPALEASAEDLVKLMVDLQKSHAGRTFRRLKQAGAQRLLRPLDEVAGSGQGLGLEFGGQGQFAHFLRRGESAQEAYLWVGFVSSGNGAVIFGPTPAAVDETRKVLADLFHWPALQ
jgi:CubicO group peptidase (beta-lactamase class C family)